MTIFGKVLRRVPSALDAAMRCCNREIGWEIAQRMLTAHRGTFATDFPYAHNLEALTATFDRLNMAAWQDSLSRACFYALRALSNPRRVRAFLRRCGPGHGPCGHSTRSWRPYTELKHDTILYARAALRRPFPLRYPAGFIEPSLSSGSGCERWPKRRPRSWRGFPSQDRSRSSGPFLGSDCDGGSRSTQAARVNFCTTLPR